MQYFALATPALSAPRRPNLPKAMRPLFLHLCALTVIVALSLGGCATPVPTAPARDEEHAAGPQGREVAMHALMLLQTAYRFGGKNPEAGLDCSGLVTLVYREAVGIELAGNAAWMARQGRPIERKELRAGDLVFFNTLNRPFSHVGIYLGRGEFIHAPNSRSRVRVDRMDNAYYAARYEAARSFFD